MPSRDDDVNKRKRSRKEKKKTRNESSHDINTLGTMMTMIKALADKIEAIERSNNKISPVIDPIKLPDDAGAGEASTETRRNRFVAGDVIRGGSKRTFPGHIAMVHGNGLYDIVYDDGGKELLVPEADIEADKAGEKGEGAAVDANKVKGKEEDKETILEVGDVIEALYQDGDIWYQGVITKANKEDGLYDIVYDDGDTESEVKRNLILLLERKSNDPASGEHGGDGDEAGSLKKLPQSRALKQPDPQATRRHDDGSGRSSFLTMMSRPGGVSGNQFKRISRAEEKIMARLDKCATEMNVFFEVVDANGDGKITREELATGLSGLKDHPKGRHARRGSPLLLPKEVEIICDGLFAFADTVDHEQVLMRFREGANTRLRRQRQRESFGKLAACIVIISPLVCFLTAAVLAVPLAAVEGWDWEGSMYLIMGEITQIDVSMGHDDFEAETTLGRVFVCLIGIWCLAFLAMLIGVMAGPLLAPLQEMMMMVPSDEKDVIGGIDVGGVQDPPRMILRTVLKMEHSLNELMLRQSSTEMELALIKQKLGIAEKASLTSPRFRYADGLYSVTPSRAGGPARFPP